MLKPRRIYTTAHPLHCLICKITQAAKGGCPWLPHGVNFLVPEPRRLWVYFPGAIPRPYLPRFHRQVELQNYKHATMAISLTSCLQTVTTGSLLKRRLHILSMPP